MRILFISGHYPPETRGGGEISTHYIAQGLVSRGHEVVVLAQGEADTDTVFEGVRVVRTPLQLTAKPLLERRHSRRQARLLQVAIERLGEFEVVHAHDFRSALALSELSLPNTIVTARDYAQISGSTNNFLVTGETAPGDPWGTLLKNHRIVEAAWWRKPFRLWQYKYNIGYRRAAFHTFAHQIFISHAQQAEIAQGQDLSRTHTHVIYNPLSTEYLEAPLVTSSVHQWLYVGTVEFYKGVRLLLQVFKQLASQYPDVQLRIVGDGAHREAYEQLVARWGLQYRVTFTGRVPWNRLRHVYDQAGVVIAPHLWVEPFGRTVVEGMARGKVVVAAETGGPTEIIESEKNGWLFTPGSDTALQEVLTAILHLPERDRLRMGRSAHEWTKAHLTQERIAAQHEEVYKMIVADT